MCVRVAYGVFPQAAFDCLVAIGKSIETRPSTEGSLSMHQYVDFVVAGFASTTPHMRSATILALSRLLYQFSESMQEQQIDRIMESVHLLLQSHSREVIKSSLSFIKVALTVLHPDTFERYVCFVSLALGSYTSMRPSTGPVT